MTALAVTIFFAGCNKHSSTASTVVVSTEVAPQPARVGPVTLNLKLSDSSGKPVSGAHIALEGDMSHPGMAPVFGEAKEIEAGRYQGSLQINMSGDWVMLVHIELTNGMKLERQINLNGVQAN